MTVQEFCGLKDGDRVEFTDDHEGLLTGVIKRVPDYPQYRLIVWDDGTDPTTLNINHDDLDDWLDNLSVSR